jgi:hypothetical protein
LPRWIRAPLAVDWLTPEELAEPLAQYKALLRYVDGVRRWCAPQGLDRHRIEQGYPRMPCQAAADAMATDPPPSDLVAAVLADEQAARERLKRWRHDQAAQRPQEDDRATW